MGRLRVIAKNNLIAIVIHIGICLFSFLFFITASIAFFMFLPIVLPIFALLVFYLYFRAGKRLLSNTNNALMNVFSVMALSIILMATIATPEGIWIIANYPFAALGAMFGDAIPVAILISLLPSLAMWIGTAKQMNDVSFDDDELSY
ncbi:MAG: hypothetical protein LBU83_06125 [Bacteroidales bacterium]|jgi:hypothetical protein|nr:hypothetical protein [Bacteroidales bacterium]